VLAWTGSGYGQSLPDSSPSSEPRLVVTDSPQPLLQSTTGKSLVEAGDRAPVPEIVPVRSSPAYDPGAAGVCPAVSDILQQFCLQFPEDASCQP